LQLLSNRIQISIAKAMQQPLLQAHAKALGAALQRVGQATQEAWSTGSPTQALANAVPYMQAFGHTVLAWTWLDVACVALNADTSQTQAVTQGRMAAARYFFHYELPKIDAWLGVVRTRDTTCADLAEDAF
jgi:butyryl-CoA dehydrogenase